MYRFKTFSCINLENEIRFDRTDSHEVKYLKITKHTRISQKTFRCMNNTTNPDISDIEHRLYPIQTLLREMYVCSSKMTIELDLHSFKIGAYLYNKIQTFSGNMGFTQFCLWHRNSLYFDDFSCPKRKRHSIKAPRI